MTNQLGTRPASRPTPDERKANRGKVLMKLDASADRIEKLITSARKRRQVQRDAGDKKGAAASLKMIDRARRVENNILRARIKVIDNSEAVRKLLNDFKAVNDDLKTVREDLKDLTKNLERVAKVIGVLEKILKKVATSGIA